MVCILLFVSIGPVTASAAYGEYLDYANMDYTVKYGTDYNTVTYNIDPEWYMFWWNSYSTGAERKVVGQDTLRFGYTPGTGFDVRFFPAHIRGFLLDNIPAGTRLCIEIELDQSKLEPNSAGGFYYVYQKAIYMDSNLTNLKVSTSDITLTAVEDNVYTYLLDYTIEDVDNAVGFVPYILFENYTGDGIGTLQLKVNSAYVEMDVSKEFWSEFQSQQNGKMLGEIKDELGNVNDKLDDTNEKLDELPGEIGDEMQGIIDSENEKAESSGNKFVNQILDKLPDPSTEVLGSLKGLTDSMAYTGTDCKLQIPALVIPAIDGLFPETEIWGGTEFFFSDYLSFLPPALLTVVQSLFTIAIVLYCVYELKGIISYCLTLNDKKGG